MYLFLISILYVYMVSRKSEKIKIYFCTFKLYHLFVPQLNQFVQEYKKSLVNKFLSRRCCNQRLQSTAKVKQV